MLESDREEFEKHLAVLLAALDKPPTAERRHAFFKGCSKMSLVDFARAVELMLTEMGEGPRLREFTVNQIWEAKKRLRAPPPPQLSEVPRVPAAPVDPWWIESNFKFLHYIGTHVARGASWAKDPQSLAIFVAYKNAWARDMREEDHGSGVDPNYQKSNWEDCMARAAADVKRWREEREEVCA